MDLSFLENKSHGKDMTVEISVDLANIHLSVPIIAASGTYGYGDEYQPLLGHQAWGAIITKAVSLKPLIGNPPPRIWETPCGLLNSIGLQNIGIERFIKEKCPIYKSLNIPVIVNFFGFSIEEYGEMAKLLDSIEVIKAVEVNISCPNKKETGMIFGHDPKLTFQVTAAVKENTNLPVIVKLTPNVTDIKNIAIAAKDGGADILSLVNTVSGMAIDIESGLPRLGGITGGLSGPAIKPIALKMVWDVAEVVDIPIIGIGGIKEGPDAIEFFMAGASAVQIGTAIFSDPTSPLKIKDYIVEFLKRKKMKSINEIIGITHQKLKEKMERINR